MSIRNEIAKNILFHRKRLGYTQKQLAELVGVKNTAVSNWENGENSIDIETLLKLCEIFEVNITEMYGIYGIQNKYSAKEEIVISAYRNKPEMQAAVDKLLGIEESDISDDMIETVNSVKHPTRKK
ncbi:MAG: helix-turn-helix transcriptional regulator [Clostridia bacterium]|nr:helix-turn-helix transcriptional regulator [Clostridia bacterium]